MQSSIGSTKILPSPISPFSPLRPPFDDGVDRRFDELLVDGNLQLDLSEQIDAEFVAAIDTRLPFLASKSLAIHHGQSKDLDLGQSFFDGFQLARLNDGDDQFHGGGNGFGGGFG